MYNSSVKSSYIKSTSETIKVIEPPKSVELEQKTSNEFIFAFQEREITLESDLQVDITKPGKYGPNSSLEEVLTPGKIKKGTKVTSYFLHFDGEDSDVEQSGSITFSQEILGIIVTDSKLDATDDILGATDTAYPTNLDARGQDVGGQDSVTLEEDRRTLKVKSSVFGSTDHFRVIMRADVFFTDFNDGIPPEFSGAGNAESVQEYEGVGDFSGQFLRNSTSDPASQTTLTLTDLPEHSSINIEFLLAIIATWDGDGGDNGPDFFNVVVDGETIFSETFLAPVGSGSKQSYDPPEGVFLGRGNFGFGGGGDKSDAAYNMGLDPTFSNIPHTSSSITIEWFASGDGWQGGDDESWAIDNVRVSVNKGGKELPTVTITPGTNPVEASKEPGKFNLSLSNPAPAGGITVNFSVSGTAKAGEDYQEFSKKSVSFAEGKDTATIEVVPIQDEEEADKTVKVTLEEGEGYSVGKTKAATLTIVEEETEAPINLAPLKVVGSEFTQNKETGFYEATGTIKIGLKEGDPFPLVILNTTEEGIVKLNEEIFEAKDVVVLSAVGGVDKPLFEGDFEIEVGKAKTKSLTNKTNSETEVFKLGGLEVQVSSLAFDSNPVITSSDSGSIQSKVQASILLGGSVTLPSELGSQTVQFENNRVKISSDGVNLVGTGIPVPPIEFTVVDSLKFTTKQLPLNKGLILRYDPKDSLLKLSGTIGIPEIFKGATIIFDFSEAKNNFIGINPLEVKGIGIAQDIGIFDKDILSIDVLKIKIDTTKESPELELEGAIIIGRLPYADSFIFGALFTFDPFGVKTLKVGADGLYTPIGSTGLVLQSIVFDISSNGSVLPVPVPLPEKIAAGFTVGPEIEKKGLPVLGDNQGNSNSNDSDTVALVLLDLEAEVKNFLAGSLKGIAKIRIANGVLGNGQGEVVLDWNQKLLKAEAEFNYLGGLIQTDAKFKASAVQRDGLKPIFGQERDFGLDLEIYRSVKKITLPDTVPLLGGKNLFSGTSLLRYRDDDSFSNDFIAGWVTIPNPIPFVGGSITGGFKVSFDGNVDILTKPLATPQQNLALAAQSPEETDGFDVAPNTQWITLGVQWENASDNVKVRLKDPDGNTIEESGFGENIAIVEELTDSITRTVAVGQPKAGTWNIEVVDDTGLGKVESAGYRDSTPPTIEVTAPTAQVSGPEVTIEYEVSEAESEVEVSLFYNDNKEELDGIPIATGIKTANGIHSFVWNTEGVATGNYFIYAEVMDDVNPPQSNYAEGQVEITEEADLSVTKTADTDLAEVGGNITYTIQVSNNGSADSKGVKLTETLPDGVNFVSATLDPAEQSDGTLTFDLGNLANGDSTSFDITVSPTQTGTISSSSSITSRTYDPNVSNDSRTITTDVVESLPPEPVDLSISRLDSVDSVSVGENFTYVLTITNNGLGNATDVSLTDKLPSGVEFVNATSTASKFDFNVEDRRLTANLGSLKSGEEVTVTVTIQPTLAEPLVAYTSVTSNEKEANPTNNSIIERTGTTVNPAISMLKGDNNIFVLEGDCDHPQIEVNLTESSSNFANQIGVVVVEDNQGTITRNGESLTPGQEGYLKAALSQSQVVLSALAEGFDNLNPTRHLSFDIGSHLLFYLVVDSTTDNILADLDAGRTPANVFFTSSSFNADGVEHLRVSESSDGKFTLAWEDEPGGGDQDFNDVVFTIQATDQPLPAGIQLQGKRELLDLREIDLNNDGVVDSEVLANFVVNSKANFNNFVGLYVVENEQGLVIDPQTNQAVSPGEAGYAQAAIRQSQVSFDRNGISPVRLQGGQLLAPYIIADGSPDEFLAQNPDNQKGQKPLAYFAYLTANRDRTDHVSLLADNTFGFEDQYGGGDRSFNDMVFQVNLSVA